MPAVPASTGYILNTKYLYLFYFYAQNNLGLAYAMGYGIEQDYQQAISWYRKSAVQIGCGPVGSANFSKTSVQSPKQATGPPRMMSPIVFGSATHMVVGT